MSRISDSDSLDFTAYTMSLWFKTTETQNKVVIEKAVSNYYIFSDDSACGGKWMAGAKNDVGNRLCADNELNDNNWHHAAVSYTNSAANFYVDGVLNDSIDPTTTATINASPITIGGRSGTFNFTGNIDDVRIFNRALSQQEILDTMYKTTLSSAESSGLVGRWQMSEGTGQTVADSSGNNNNGTLGADDQAGSDDPTWSTDTPVPTSSSLSTSEKIFAGGYKTTSSAANQGIYYDKTVSAGNDWVVRAIANSNGISQPKIILYDQTNGAEIGSLTGTTTSTRAAPDVFIFTGEAPTGQTTLRVKLINTASSGTTYWHQVEVLSNLIINPSIETGSGDPWIPTGWTNSAMEAGEGAQETTIIHSGASSFKLNSNTNQEGIKVNEYSVTTNAFYAHGGWMYESSGNIKAGIANTGMVFQTTANSTFNIQPSGASWTRYSGIARRNSSGSYQWDFVQTSTTATSGYADDFYIFKLTDVSLTVTPASEANSTENTDEIRVDGRDTYTASSSEAISISTTSGYVSFNWRPRHSAADSVKFAETTSDDAYIVSFAGDSDDYINVYWDSANTIAMTYSMAGTTGSGSWDATSAIAANTEYAGVIQYTGGGTMIFSVGGTTRITLSSIPSAFGTAPNTVYWGSNTSGGNQGDSTFSSFVFDNTAPSISLTALSTDPNSDNTPTLSGTATESIGTVSNVQFQMDSTSGSWTACSADDASFDEATEAFTCTPSALSDGSHTLYVRATDSNSNTTASGSESSDTFTIDATAPTVSVTAISPDPGADTTPTISGTATDTGGTISNVQFQVDSTAGSWSSCTASDGSFNSSSESFNCTTAALSDGSHTIYVRAVDNASNNSSSASDAFTVDITTPSSFDLDSPGDNSYTSSERPTFKWKTTTDTTAGLWKYVLEIDNPSLGSGQVNGDFTIDSIPTSRTTDYETNKYYIHYENFSDSDSNNNYISVYAKSSTEWSTDSSSGQNDGKLREGKVSWKVKAVDNAGNETTSSRTLFVDRTGPTVEFTQINDLPSTSKESSSATLEVFFTLSTTDKTPTIYGKITDSLAGGDSSLTQDENGPKVASGPKQVEIKIEKKEGLIYKVHTLYTLSFDKPWYACDNREVSDNSKQKCDKYLPFEYTPGQELDLGTYKITITGKDKADNTSSDTSFTINITTLAQITTPREEELIEETLKELPKEDQEEVKERLEITKPTEAEKPNVLEAVGSKIVNSLTNLWWKLVDGGKSTAKTIASIWNGYKDFTTRVNQKTTAFKDKVTTRLNQNLAFVSQKVSQGLASFGKTTQSLLTLASDKIKITVKSISEGYNQLANNASGATKTILLIVGKGASAVAVAIDSIVNYTATATATIAQRTADKIETMAKTATNTANTVVNTGKQIGQNITTSVAQAFVRPLTKFSSEITRLKEKTQTYLAITSEYWFDKEPTRILVVKVEKVNSTSAVIYWQTNHHATSVVNYGFDTSYGKKVQSSERVKDHRLELIDLTPGKTYFFEVMSQNKNYVYDAYYTLTTPWQDTEQATSQKGEKVKGLITEKKVFKKPMVEVVGNKNDWVLVRKAPGQENDVVAKVQVGQTFQLLQEQDGWFLIKFDGEQGWIFGEFGKLTEN